MSPYKPKKPCSFPGCPLLTDNRFCEIHQRKIARQYDQKRGTPTSRGYDSNWRKIRKQFMATNPLCMDCQAYDRLQPATEVHHVVGLQDGGTHDENNLRSLCKTCHSRLTMKNINNRQRRP